MDSKPNIIKARKRPIVVEAMHFTDENKNKVFNWVSCNHYADFDEHDNPTIIIKTLEGNMIASIGDYIIKGVTGEFYPCKPDIFDKTYEVLNGN